MNIINKRRLNDIMEQGFRFDIGEYISEAFEIIKQEIGLFIGYILIVFLILFFAGLISSVFQIVAPYSVYMELVGQFTSQIVTQLIAPPLLAGFLIAGHKVHRQRMAHLRPPGIPGSSEQGYVDRAPGLEFSDFFQGFQHYGQLVTQAFLLLGITLLLFIPLGLVGYILGAFEDYPFGLTSFVGSDFAILAIMGIIIFCAYVYILVSYIYAPAFIIFGDMQAWEAMETSRKVVNKNFWIIFGFGIVLGLLYLGGIILCCVGLLFTAPLIYVSIYTSFKGIMAFDDPNYNNPEDDILDHLVD